MFSKGLFNYKIFRNFATSRKLQKYFGEERFNQLVKEYEASIHIEHGLPNTESFNDYQAERMRSLDKLLDFKDIRSIPKKDKDYHKKVEELPKMLADSSWQKISKEDDTQGNKALVKGLIADALKDNDDLDNALKDFNDTLNTINEKLQEIPPQVNYKTLPGALHLLKLEAKKKIEAHQQQAKTQIEGLFTGSKDEIMKALEIPPGDEAAFNTAKEEFFKAFEKAQQDELAKFEESCNENIIQLGNEIENEKKRVAQIEHLRLLFGDVRKNINELAKEHRREKPLTPGPGRERVILTTDEDKSSIALEGVRVEDLPYLRTITGRRITIETDSDGKKIFRMHLPSIGPLYYNSPHQNIDYDMQSLVEGLRACGYESITLNVNFKDPKKAAMFAQRLYTAGINAGYPPEKLKISVNGIEKKVKADPDADEKEVKKNPPLFNSTEYERLEGIAQRLKEKTDKQYREPEPADMDFFKEELAKIKAPIEEDHRISRPHETPSV